MANQCLGSSCARSACQTGLAEIQCLYAPEFNSHSESLPLVVK